MGDAVKEPVEKPKEPVALERKRIVGYDIDTEEIELKLLDDDDLDEIIKVFKKVAVPIGRDEVKEIKNILADNMSYGAYVDRILVGLFLAWPFCFDQVHKGMATCDDPNALYLEDMAVLSAYEAKGVRDALLKQAEKVAKENSFPYIVTVVGENPAEEDILKVIEDRGTRHERHLLSRGYKFFKSEYGLAAYKNL